MKSYHWYSLATFLGFTSAFLLIIGYAFMQLKYKVWGEYHGVPYYTYERPLIMQGTVLLIIGTILLIATLQIVWLGLKESQTETEVKK